MTVEPFLVPPFYALPGNPQERYLCYSRRFFLRGAPLDLATEKCDLDIAIIDNSASRGPIFDQALLSFATVVFGFEHKQSHIMEQGYNTHQTALRRLNKALSQPDCASRDDVLLSIVALAMLESQLPSSPGSYLYHVIGLDKLLELRDPMLHITPWSLNIYKSIRHFLIFACLRVGRSSVLALPRWKAVLKLDCDQEELHEQQLWDILADCTALQARRDTMLSGLSFGCELLYGSRADEAGRIRDETYSLLDKLDVWHIQWTVMEGSTYFRSTRCHQQQNTGTESVDLPSSYQFAKDDTAKRLMLYNTIIMYALQLLLHLSRTPQCHGIEGWNAILGYPEVNSTVEYVEQLGTSLVHAATEVCRCVPHFLERDLAVRQRSSPVVQWSISAAWSVLKDTDTEERKWLDQLMKLETGRFLARGLFDRDRL